MPNILILIAIAAVPGFILAIDQELSRRRAKSRRPPPMVVPSAEETAAVIERFREAVHRFKQTEFAWEMERIRALTERDSRGILRRRHLRRTSR